MKVVAVTGGATGIGAASVERFIGEGWHVVLCHHGAAERAAAQALQRRAEAAGRRLVLVDVDVTVDADCRRIAAVAEAAFGRLDALVCSAGVTRIVPHDALDALTMDDFDLTSRVNVGGVFQSVRACVPLMRATGAGAVVIVSSYGGVFGGGSSIAYAASKGAANTLTLSLARALAPEIRVNAVCPALVSGGFAQRLDPALFDQRRDVQAQRAPLQKIAAPAEVAGDIYWLAASTTLMTGNLVMLDCGMHLNGDG